MRGGADGEVQINNLTPDDRIKTGERVVTSGGDQVFPRGLPVGVITRIVPDPQHQPYTAITIKPAANLQQLEEVLVVTGTSEALPAAAQKDAAAAETLAAENKRAADLIAERLPSLRESPTGEQLSSAGAEAAGEVGVTGASGSAATKGKPVDTADQVGGLPGIPSSGVPRVRAALHTDRFSPGATPSAEALTPGAPANRTGSPLPAAESSSAPSSASFPASSAAAFPAQSAAQRSAAHKTAPPAPTSARLAKPATLPPASPPSTDQP